MFTNKFINLISILFVSYINAYPQSYIKFNNGVEQLSNGKQVVTSPLKDIQQYSNYTTIEYNIDGATIQNIVKNEVNYTILKINGFGLSNEEGNPTLPMYNDIIALPKNSNLIIELVSAEYKDFKNYKIYPAQGPNIDSDTIKPFKINQRTYQSNNFYPIPLVKLKTTQDYKGINLAFVHVNPVQYNPATNTIRCYSKIKYRLKYNNTNFNRSINSLDSKILSNIITNKEILSRIPIYSSAAKEYIIVTTNKYLPAVQRFVSWKKKIGFNIRILAQDSWTSEQVKQRVHYEYNTSFSFPEYLLIVGDNEDVPAQYIYKFDGNEPYYTDLYYVCMGGNADYIPDMAKGRISVSSLDEANIVFDKIINYENNPPTDPSFYQNGINCSYFQAQNDNKTAQHRFVLTCEEVRNYLISKKYNINRIYCTKSYVSPQYYNNTYYANNEPIPNELKRPNFAWNGNKIDIKNDINNGTFYVLHRDHGNYYEWGDPNYTIADIAELTNGDKLPVVFSINCQTGAFNKPICFSEKLLRHPSGGAVGVFCATELSYSGFNDALTIGMFDAIWSVPGLTVRFGSEGIVNPNLNEHKDIYSMGDILNQGLLRMSQTWSDEKPEWDYENYTYEIFHYLGDPGMEIYTAVPSIFSNVTISKKGSSITVNTGGVSNCKITLCSEGDNGKSYFATEDNTSSHTFTNVDVACSICITKHNYIPYFYTEDVFIQNKTFIGTNIITGNNIKIGNDVTPSTAQGNVTISNKANVIIDAKNQVILDAGFKCDKGGILTIK